MFRLEHLIAGGVAVAIVVTALNEGGYGVEFTAALSILLWWAIALAAGIIPRARVGRLGMIATALFVAFVTLMWLSMLWAADEGRAFDDTVRGSAYLGVFVLALLTARTENARSWMQGITIGLAALTIIALATRFEPTLGNENEITRLVGSTQGRLSFPLGYWNALGACMAMALVAFAWSAVRGSTALARAIAVAMMPLAALAIFFSSSRGSIIAGAVGLTVLVLCERRRSRLLAGILSAVPPAALLITVATGMDGLQTQVPLRDASSEGALLTLVAVAVVGVTIALAYRFDSALDGLRIPRPPKRLAIAVGLLVFVGALLVFDPIERIDAFKQPPAPPSAVSGDSLLETRELLSGGGNGRYQLWESALDAFRDKPLAGIGTGGFRLWFARRSTIPYSVNDAHSLPIETLAELGLIGFGLLASFLAIAVYAGVRARRASGLTSGLLGLIAAGAIAVAVDWSSDFPTVVIPILIAIALLFVIERPGTSPLRSARATMALRGGVAALAAAFIWVGATGYLSQRDLTVSRAAVAAGDYDRAVDAASSAVDRQPWSAQMRAQLALAAERDGDLETALSAVKEATDRSPDGALWFLRARIELESGNVREAEAALEQSRVYLRTSPIFAVGS